MKELNSLRSFILAHPSLDEARIDPSDVKIKYKDLTKKDKLQATAGKVGVYGGAALAAHGLGSKLGHRVKHLFSPKQSLLRSPGTKRLAIGVPLAAASIYGLNKLRQKVTKRKARRLGIQARRK